MAIVTDWLYAILSVFMLLDVNLVLIWTIVELGIGILATSAATLRSLLQYFKFTGLSDSSQGSGGRARSHSSWHELSRVQEEGLSVNKGMDRKSATVSDMALCESERPESLIVHAK
jgi:hypothetical protein